MFADFRHAEQVARLAQSIVFCQEVSCVLDLEDGFGEGGMLASQGPEKL